MKVWRKEKIRALKSLTKRTLTRNKNPIAEVKLDLLTFTIQAMPLFVLLTTQESMKKVRYRIH